MKYKYKYKYCFRVVGVDSRGEDKDSTNCVICLTGKNTIYIFVCHPKLIPINKLIHQIKSIHQIWFIFVVSSPLFMYTRINCNIFFYPTSLHIRRIMISIARLPTWRPSATAGVYPPLSCLLC